MTLMRITPLLTPLYTFQRSFHSPKVTPLVKNKITEEEKRSAVLESARVKKIFYSGLFFSKESQTLAEALNSGEFHHPLFSSGNKYPYLALQALYEKKISTESFSTLLSYWAIKSNIKNPATYQIRRLISEDNSVDKKNLAILKNNLVSTEPTISSFFSSEKKLDLFIENLRKFPRSEHNFFLIKLKKKNGFPSFSDDLASKIFLKTQFNAFLFVEEESTYYQMVPSHGMKQAFLNTMSPEDPVQLVPKIGPSDLTSIQLNAMRNTRDMALSFPEVELPKVAHESKIRYPWDFTFHDFYHAYIANYIPRTHQVAFKILSDKFKEEQTPFFTPLKKEFFNLLSDQLIDMEHNTYRHQDPLRLKSKNGATPAKVTAFLKSLESVMIVAVLTLAEDSIKNTEDKERAIDDYFHLLESRGLIDHAAIVVAKNLNQIKDLVFQIDKKIQTYPLHHKNDIFIQKISYHYLGHSKL